MPKAVPILERFCNYLPDELPDDGCWEWQGTKNKAGYGQLGHCFQGVAKSVFAHRFSWEAHNAEPIPKGMVVRHDCDNPACVNPAHLRLGTQGDNVADAVRRNRTCKGERNGMQKLSADQVNEIHALIEQGELNQKQIAARYGITHQLVQRIGRAKAWKHLGLAGRNRRPRGERGPGAKLKEAQVLEIHFLHQEGWNQCQIARRFQVKPCTINQIVNGKTWKHLHPSNATQSHPSPVQP